MNVAIVGCGLIGRKRVQALSAGDNVVACCDTNKEIGEKIFLSVRTVEGLRLKIIEKMNVKNTAGIIVYAIRENLYIPQV